MTALQVLREMLDIQTELQAVTETYGGRFSAMTGTDSAEGRDPQDVGGPPDQLPQQALLSECAAACDKLDATDQDFAHRLDSIADQIRSETGLASFQKKKRLGMLGSLSAVGWTS